MSAVKLSYSLMYDGNPRAAADQVAALEKAGLDTVWVAEAYGFDSPTLMGYLAARTETVEIGSAILNIYSPHARRARADRGRARQRLRRPRGPRPRRLRPAGDRGLARRALRQAARPHPRGRRHRPARRCAARCSPTTASSSCRCPRRRRVTGLGKPLKMLTRPERDRASRSGSPRSGRRTSSRPPSTPTAGSRTCSPPSWPHKVWGDALAAGAAKRSAELGPLQVAAGGMVAIGEGPETKGLLDFARPMFALYIGGMGAKGKNFYNDLVPRVRLRGGGRGDPGPLPRRQEGRGRGAGPAPSCWRCATSSAPSRTSRSGSRPSRSPASPTSTCVPGHRGPGRHRRPAQGMDRLRCVSRPGPLRARARGLPPDRPDLLRAGGRAPPRRSGRRTASSPREVWRKAGEAGLLCFDVPEEYGGPGIDDFRFNQVLSEEQTRAGAVRTRASRSTPTSSSPTSPRSGPRSRSSAGCPGCVTGEIITAIAMTEPGAG